MLFQTHKTSVYLRNTLRYIWWNPRAFWPSINSSATDTFKTQKASKDISGPTIMLWRYDNTFCALLYSTLLLLCVSLRHTFMRITWHMRCGLFATVVNAHWSLKWKRRNSWIKVIFVFNAHKKYSRCHMNYVNDVPIPFWVLNVVVVLLSMEGQKALGVQQKKS